MVIYSILLAAGKSTRLERIVPKQYVEINDLPLICYSIDKLINNKEIKKLKIVINEHDENYFKHIEKLYHKKGIELERPIIGGESRQESVLNALSAINNELINPDFILIHDAARPFFSSLLIDRLFKNITKNSGVIPAVDIIDTLKKQDPITEKYISLNREDYKLAQTPQMFCFQSIYAAHLNCIDLKNYTDDSSIAEEFNIPVKVIRGEEDNFKITNDKDFKKAVSIINTNNNLNNYPKRFNNIRIGQGFDVHRFTNGNKIRLYGVDIPCTQSLLGHSDADVGLHSITDAILGAIGKGDIGEHFCDDDRKWKNADSSIFLTHALNLLKKNNGKIINIDTTLICETPKINNFKLLIKNNLSHLLEINKEYINIKATTTEKLGFLGREEGIACQSIVLICFEN